MQATKLFEFRRFFVYNLIMDKKYINNFINLKFFDYPKGKFKSSRYSRKFRYLKTTLEIFNPTLVVCHKSTEFDEYLVAKTITTDYVVLRPWVASQIFDGTLSESNKKELFASIAELKEAMLSIVMFPEKQISIFGSSEKLPETTTEFMFETKMNLKFINFPGAYFAKPIWSKTFRHTQTLLSSRFNLSHKLLSTLTKQERNQKINGMMPASASIYSTKSSVLIRSNNLAAGLESVVFACPNCLALFSLKSEFNHLKCQSCQIPFECLPSGEIYLNGHTVSYDDIEKFLDETIKKIDFKTAQITTFDNVSYSNILLDEKIKHPLPITVDIYISKIKLSGFNLEENISFKDVASCEYLPNNSVRITLKSKDIFELSASPDKNLYLIFALIKNKLNKKVKS